MNTIITIGRQFGSAGREIGAKVAEKYGIPFYDKELLSRAAKESGFCEEMIATHDERPTNSFLYNIKSNNSGIAELYFCVCNYRRWTFKINLCVRNEAVPRRIWIF